MYAQQTETRSTVYRILDDDGYTIKYVEQIEIGSYFTSPFGGITLGSDGERLIGLWFDGQKYFADTLGKEHDERPDLEIFGATCCWLDIYFSGHAPDFTPPLLMRTTDFRKQVWEIMLTIPFGQTMTYGDISRIIAKERGLTCMSAQAVGGAVGHNSISLIIPCHRVVGANGSLTGYTGGIDKKVRLLQMEGAMMQDLFVKNDVFVRHNNILAATVPNPAFSSPRRG